MIDVDVAWLTHGREGWIHSTRPKYALLEELKALIREIERRGLDWCTWEGRRERFYDAVRRMSPNIRVGGPSGRDFLTTSRAPSV